MAEAHSAVAFSFSVTPEGVNVKLNHEALRAVWRSGVRSFKKRVGRMQVNDKRVGRMQVNDQNLLLHRLRKVVRLHVRVPTHVPYMCTLYMACFIKF